MMSSRGLYTCLGQNFVPVCQSEWLYSSECPGTHCGCMNEKHTVRDSARLKTTPSGPAYCRCGAPRVPTLNHLFLTEDLTKVPPRLKYDKSKYRSVHVDGRTYFLLQSEYAGPLWTEEQYSDSVRGQLALNDAGGTVEFACGHGHDNQQMKKCLKDKRIFGSHLGARPSSRRPQESYENLERLKRAEMRNDDFRRPREVIHNRILNPGLPRRITHLIVPRHRRSSISVSGSEVRPSVLREARSWGTSAAFPNGRNSRLEIPRTANDGYNQRRSRCRSGKPKYLNKKSSLEQKIAETECWRVRKHDAKSKVTQNHQRPAIIKQEQVRRIPRRSIGRSKCELLGTATVYRTNANNVGKSSTIKLSRDVQNDSVASPEKVWREKQTPDAKEISNNTHDRRRNADVHEADASSLDSYARVTADNEVVNNASVTTNEKLSSPKSNRHRSVTFKTGVTSHDTAPRTSNEKCDTIKSSPSL
ncbi:uncharacterized protein LOC111267173 isoform X2 [Varroa jacobsoni]|uniref:uncharacterized protein LOC111267173 isoform X2 n=1 Tax=Varroa jacobsoni TaxID=62625 RepID=UPI000BF75F26|nr:uncharacterized protein LOC111267173 isoform X2 [Varroa jacobsoni]